jgi:chromosome partitioning protein
MDRHNFAKMAAGQAGSATVITIFNQKGGIGKTTTSVNLGICLAAAGWRVGLIDVDSQANATSSLGLLPVPARGAYHLLVGEATLEETLVPTLWPGLSVCRATDELAGIDVELVLEEESHTLLKRRLKAGPLPVDVLIIDCPPALGMLPVNALVASDMVLIPVTPEPMAHDGLHRAWRHIQRIRSNLNPRLVIAGVVLTMVRNDPVHAAHSAAVRDELGERVLAIEVPLDPRVLAASDRDLPACVFDPASAAARAYFDLAALVIDQIGRLAQAADAGISAADLPRFDAARALGSLREWHDTIRPLLPPPAPAAEPEPPPEPPEPAAVAPDDRSPLRTPALVLAAAVAGFALGAWSGIQGWLSGF